MSEACPARVYTPDSSLARPSRVLPEMLRDLAAGREMAWRLAVRDIRSQYRQAFLGLFWAFLSPLFTSLSWIFLQGSGLVSLRSGDMPYGLYVFSGTILWSTFVEAVNAPLNQVATSSGMLAKLNFPREALVVSGIYQTFFNSAIKITLLAGALVAAKVSPDWRALLVPLGIGALILAGTAVGLLLVPISSLYGDIRRALPIVLGFTMFLTPVVYAPPKSGLVATIARWNPLSHLVVTTRGWLTGAPPESLLGFAIVTLVAAAVLLFGWVAYRLAMPILIERMSA